MDATTVGVRLASSTLGPLVKRLFHQRPPGAGLAERPVRLDALVAIGREKDALTPDDLRALAGEITDRGLAGLGPEAAGLREHRDLLADVLAARLGRLGTLDMDDVQAVTLGPDALARALTEPPAETARRGLGAREEEFCASLTWLACLHIIDFFTRRSTFVARTLVEQARRNARLLTALDLLAARLPDRSAEDAAFEDRYRRHLSGRHGRLTVFGLDLDDDWPLDDAYLQLETTRGRPTGDLPQTPQRAEEALRGRERVLLRGVAGAGKTTLVQWLAVTTAEHRVPEPLLHLLGRVPFVLPLRTLTRHDRELPPPADFLSAVNCPHTPPAGWAERVLTAGRGLLLIDGIDEMPEETRAMAKAWLRELVRDFPGNVALVTGRPSAVGEDWLADEGFTELSLAPMTQQDVGTFIHRWHRAAGEPEEDARELLAAVRSRQDLARLATNPLMCAVMCALHRSGHGYLPSGRTALYEAALRMLLERRDRQRRVRSAVRLDAETQTLLLQKLAYWLIRNGHAEIDRADAEGIIEAVLPLMPQVAAQGDAAAVCRYLLERSGLLREPSEGQIEFVHRTFQDYLGAREAIEARDIPFLVRNAHRDQWEDVVRMAVAHGRPEERRRLLTALVKRGDATKRHRVRLHLLAMACLEHATQLDPATRALVTSRAADLLPPRTYAEADALRMIGPVVVELLPGPEGLSPQETQAVLNTLRRIGGDAALARLATFCESPHWFARLLLASAWGLFDTDSYADTILPRLAPDAIVRVSSTAHLAHLAAYDRLYSADGIDPAVLLAAGVADRCHSLRLHREWDAALLDRFPALRRLSLWNDAIPPDLSAVRRAALTEIHIVTDDGRRLDGLDSLGGVEDVILSTGADRRLDALPHDIPVTELRCFELPHGLGGIDTWPRLRSIRVEAYSFGMKGDDWRAIARSRATTLQFFWEGVRSIDPNLVLPRISSLTVSDVARQPDTDQLARIFPHVESLRLDVGADMDLRPLRSLRRLRSLELDGIEQADVPAFPPGVQVTVILPSRYGPVS